MLHPSDSADPKYDNLNLPDIAGLNVEIASARHLGLRPRHLHRQRGDLTATPTRSATPPQAQRRARARAIQGHAGRRLKSRRRLYHELLRQRQRQASTGSWRRARPISWARMPSTSSLPPTPRALPTGAGQRQHDDPAAQYWPTPRRRLDGGQRHLWRLELTSDNGRAGNGGALDSGAHSSSLSDCDTSAQPALCRAEICKYYNDLRI